LQSNKQGNWYFYNNQSLGFGKTEFQKTWGNRKLEDNWRWSASIKTNTSTADSLQVNTKNLRYDLANYIKTIPTQEGTLDTLKLDRNQALYELGLIYKEQFKNPDLAIKRLKRVASLNPKKELILPINWHLYQIYKGLENEPETTKYKEEILTKYPNTVFAKIIKSPNKQITEDVVLGEVENKYKEVYYLYKEGKFKETEKQIIEILPTIKNSKLIPKFELLRAYAIGKYTDTETYKIALESVAINYANTVEGKKAQEIANQLSK
jgi:tetratricopeptide (TPR) repeat protein